MTQHDADQRVDCLNAIYHREAERAGASILPLAAWTCRSADDCIEEVDGVQLRYDGIHFQDEGADVAASWAAPLLRSAHAEQQEDAEQRERAGAEPSQRALG